MVHCAIAKILYSYFYKPLHNCDPNLQLVCLKFQHVSNLKNKEAVMTKLRKINTVGLSIVLISALSLVSIEGHAKGPIHWDKVTVIKKNNGHHVNQYREVSVAPRQRHFRGTHVVRHHGNPYFGYGFYATDSDAYKWLAFTAISLKILDNLNEEQQRTHESAQVKATESDVGETIIWDDSSVSGSVTTVRQGKNNFGQQCREFQQTITIGNKTEQAYGTACLKSDGSWQIVS